MTGYTRATAVTIAALTALALVGCSTEPADGSGDDDAITIVASTDVYADIASSIAGDRAEVEAIISGATQDPHSYEATARDQLALSRADLVIANGGGFDPFIGVMLASLGSEAPLLLTATEIAETGAGEQRGEEPHDHADEGDDDHAHANDDPSHADDDDHADDDGHDHSDGANEHVWYSFDSMAALADEIAHHLAEIDPDGADEYDENLAAFDAGLDELTETAQGMAAMHGGISVAVTEAAPLLLFDQLGFVNETPAEFSRAIENGTDVAPSVLLQVQRLIESGTLALLAYNEQTAGPETEQVLALAEANELPIVPIAETLPEGAGYLDWMQGTLAEIEAALS